MAATDRMVALQAYLECQHGVSLDESATNEKSCRRCESINSRGGEIGAIH